MTAVFVLARNPEPASTLPYLLQVPVPGGPLLLKAREPWPRTAKVYCRRAEPADWPADAEVLQKIPVRSCVRRGVAVDLVLDRPRENRSQLVFAACLARAAARRSSGRPPAPAPRAAQPCASPAAVPPATSSW